jgi:hypothetical protein
MNIYQIAFSFQGGCYNCPFCEREPSRRCRLTEKLIRWRFKTDPKAPKPKGEDRPIVKIKFNPHKNRDCDCPLVAQRVRAEKVAAENN